MRTYTREEMYFFTMLIQNNDISCERAIEWAYGQYDETGAPEWIDAITLEADSRGIIDIINREFELFKSDFDAKNMFGEASKLYALKKITDYDVVYYLYDYVYFTQNVDDSLRLKFTSFEDTLTDNETTDNYLQKIRTEFKVELQKYEKYGQCSYEAYLNL